jgi:hypothetical protein
MMNKHKLFTVLLLISLVGGALARSEPAAAQGAWYAEYFANRDLAGSPALTRYEDSLHFEWGAGGPGTGVPADNFSARWTRDEWFESGTYRFSYRSDDGARIWVGDALVVDDWRERQAGWTVVDRYIPRGTQRVRVEYYEQGGGAAFQASWERVSGGSGWRGEYFANRDLAGSPALVRYDAAIDFDWQVGSPDPALPADNFSVRWTRTLGFDPGAYRFHSSSDDGVRVYVNGALVVNAWDDGKLPHNSTGDVSLGSGQQTVVVEYYEHGGQASAHVWWDRLGSFSGWEGHYYDNAELRGGPTLIRDDAEINFDWGEGAPANWMPADNFSVDWTRQVNFSPGTYRFNTRSDDGVRVWLDGGLLMDYWKPQDNAWNYADNLYLSGMHMLKVEYFEQGGGARVRFWWELMTVPPSPGPVTTPTPIPVPAPSLPGPWQGEYFDNRSLSGQPVLARSDAAINFDWSWGAPATGLKSDEFSARWTGQFVLEGGRYTFSTYSDDGVRLYVDGQRVIDAWRPMRGTRSATLNLSQGTHAVRVEYFEATGRAAIRVQWARVGVSSQPVVTPTAAPRACTGGSLRLDAWPVASACTESGWTATIFVEGHGGDCQYTYAWERETRGGPTPNSMTFEIKSAGFGNAIVGQASVSSGGESVKVGLYVPPPRCP